MAASETTTTLTDAEHSRARPLSVPAEHSYRIETFTESSNPGGARQSQRIHAESFVRAGYLSSAAVRHDGTLDPALDPSRGPDVTYFLAANDHVDRSLTDQATARLVAPPPGQDYRALRAYQLMAPALAPEAHRLIEEHGARFGDGSVLDVAALARSLGSTPVASFAVLRAMVQAAVHHSHPQLWLAVMVPRPFAALQASFGELAVRQIGESVAGYRHVPAARDPWFIPTVIEPNRSLDHMVLAIRTSECSASRARIDRMLRYLVQGLPRTVLSVGVASYLEGRSA